MKSQATAICKIKYISLLDVGKCIIVNVNNIHKKENLAKVLLYSRIPTEVPTWGIKFKHDVVFHPDSLLKLKFKNYLHSTVVEDGGHFAAMENPDLLAADVFQAVDTFLQFHNHTQ